MPAGDKFITNQTDILNSTDIFKHINIGVVAVVDDPQSLGRIKVKIPGKPSQGGDDGVSINDLPWAYPMTPKYFTSKPKIGEGVFVMVHSKSKSSSDRLYFGPIISQPTKLLFDPIATTGLQPFTFAVTNPQTDVNMVPALKGVFPNDTDIAVQGRYNTDLVFKDNEMWLRVGKFIASKPNENNPYPIEFNTTTQAYFMTRNEVPLTRPKENEVQEIGTVTNVVANKINLLTHKDGYPRFPLTDQEALITNDTILDILEKAHPLPFGDLLVEYLRLLKNAFLNHVHNGNGNQPTDLVSGGATQDVLKFKTAADDLENRMLSKNIRIN